MIPVFEPKLDGNELNYLKNCIESGWVSSEGNYVKTFENKVCKEVNRKFGICVSNGTVALELAIKGLKLKEGDEIICPTFSIISTVLAIIRAGAKPVLIDSDANTWNMDTTQIEAKITTKTKAILVVHTYGMPIDMCPILELAKKYHLKIIEDAAEVIGQTYYKQPCGSFGDVSIFSFYANKTITTGEGGIILTDDEALAEKCRSLRNLCFGKNENRFLHTDFGHNYRLSNLQAAIGVAQMERLNDFLKIKRQIGLWYQHYLKDTDLQLPIHETPYSENCYWVFGVKLLDKNKKAREIIQKLKEKGIESRPFFYPMHLQSIFKKKRLFKNENYAVAENLAEQGFYLPTGMNLKKEQVAFICTTLRNIL